MPQNPNPLADLLAALQAEGANTAELIAQHIEQHDGELSALEDAALDAFNNVYGDGAHNYTDADLAQMQAATQVLETVRETRQQRESEAAERAGRAAELAGRAQPPAPPAEEAAEGDETAGPSGDGGQTAPAGAAEGAGAAPADPAPAPANTPVPVAASSRAASRADYARLATTAGTGSNWTITASADIRGVSAGAELDFDGLTDAVMRRLSALSKLGRNVKTSAPIATLALKRDEQLVASAGDERSMRQIVDYAGDERRLQGGSLTAASIWCAPSETVYDLCPDLATNEGMVDLPSITVTRGGIRYPQTPDYSEVFTQLQTGTWEWVDDDTQNDPKPCLVIPCPEFDECRLTAYGLCVQTDILVNHAWPELVSDWTQRLLTANEHLVNQRILAALQAAATPVDFAGTTGTPNTPFQPGGASGVLDILDLQAAYIRTKWRMRFTQTLEVVLPMWVRPFIRADLAKRTGVDLISVSDARLDQYFRDRNLNVQWVYDWFDIDTTAPPTSWPDTVPMLIYPAGSFVAARQDVIELSGIYDSTLLAENKFTGLFSEQAICVINRCYEALYITADLCADGATSAPVEYDCDAI